MMKVKCRFSVTHNQFVEILNTWLLNQVLRIRHEYSWTATQKMPRVVPGETPAYVRTAYWLLKEKIGRPSKPVEYLQSFRRDYLNDISMAHKHYYNCLATKSMPKTMFITNGPFNGYEHRDKCLLHDADIKREFFDLVKVCKLFHDMRLKLVGYEKAKVSFKGTYDQRTYNTMYKALLADDVKTFSWAYNRFWKDSNEFKRIIERALIDYKRVLLLKNINKRKG